MLPFLCAVVNRLQQNLSRKKRKQRKLPKKGKFFDFSKENCLFVTVLTCSFIGWGKGIILKWKIWLLYVCYCFERSEKP